MIKLLGDIHGNTIALRRSVEIAQESGATALIQIGDFGMFPDNEYKFKVAIANSEIPVYFIDGNHDDCRRWKRYDTVFKVFPDSKLYYIPRGAVLGIDGKTIAFMGGASSIDKRMRVENNWHWDMHENITWTEQCRLITNYTGEKIDAFITHVPPQSVIEKDFDRRDMLRFGVGVDWTDPDALVIEDMWRRIGYPPIYSGHMHKKCVGEIEECGKYHILDIDEMIDI